MPQGLLPITLTVVRRPIVVRRTRTSSKPSPAAALREESGLIVSPAMACVAPCPRLRSDAPWLRDDHREGGPGVPLECCCDVDEPCMVAIHYRIEAEPSGRGTASTASVPCIAYFPRPPGKELSPLPSMTGAGSTPMTHGTESGRATDRDAGAAPNVHDRCRRIPCRSAAVEDADRRCGRRSC